MYQWYQMVEHQLQLNRKVSTGLVRFSSSNPMRHICYRIRYYTSVCIIMIYHALHHIRFPLYNWAFPPLHLYLLIALLICRSLPRRDRRDQSRLVRWCHHGSRWCRWRSFHP